MTALAYRTRAELNLERLESLKRPLTDDESDQLRRSLHAVYGRTRRSNALAIHEREERELLAKVEQEATQVSLDRLG